MDCKNIKELLSLYIDDELSKDKIEEINEHLATCESCNAELKELQEIRQLLAEPLVELPIGFKEELHEKLIIASEEEITTKPISLDRFKTAKGKSPKKGLRKFNYKTYGAVAAAFLVMVSSAFILEGGLEQSKSSDDMAPEMEMNMESKSMDINSMEAPAEFGSNKSENSTYGMNDIAITAQDVKNGDMLMNAGTKYDGLNIAGNVSLNAKEARVVQENRKIITNAYMRIDTETYDETLDNIITYAKSVGGYVQSSNTNLQYYNRNNKEDNLKAGSIVIRVPKNTFQSTYDKILDLGIVVDQNISTSDITLQYRDTFDRAENLKVQEKRLREIMVGADKVSDVIEIERELTRVRGDIDNLTGRINRWDDLVSLATISVDLQEVKSTEQITTIDDNIFVKAKKGFIRSINRLINYSERMFINAVTAIPILIVWVIGLFIAFKIIQIILKKFRRD